ncbi:MAG TPA: polymer-forming cytoskeletal protein [bacterium]|nr:polymer-forming cytoskeletal protein [bacterium]
MFGKGSSGMDTLVGLGGEFKGDLNVKGTVRIDGKIEGNISASDSVIIGENAVVKGDLHAKNIIIGGKVTGDVIAASKLEILNTGELYGDIRTPRLVINEGVIFEGTCEMERAIQETQAKK